MSWGLWYQIGRSTQIRRTHGNVCSAPTQVSSLNVFAKSYLAGSSVAVMEVCDGDRRSAKLTRGEEGEEEAEGGDGVGRQRIGVSLCARVANYLGSLRME